MKKTYEYEIVTCRLGTGGGRMLYKIRHEFGSTISEKWVGINQLRRYCEEGRIVGKVPDIIRDRLNYARPVKKVRKDKGKSRKKVKLVPIPNPKPVERDVSGWGQGYKAKPMPVPTMYGPVDYFEVKPVWYSLPDIFEVFKNSA